MGMVAPIYYTAEQVRAFPEDGNRYEVVHGELLVTPAPRWTLTPDDVAPRFERDRLVWHPAAAAQAFELTLDELFRPI